MRIVFLVLIVLLSLVAPAVAQYIPPDGCERTGYAVMFSDAAYLLEADESADDPDILKSSLDFYLNTIQTRRANCAGLAFEGEGGEVIGPFDLPAGDYIVTGTFTRSGNIFFETLTDDCRLALLGSSLGIYDGNGGRKQTVLQIDQPCRLLVEASTTAPWTLIFVPIS